MIKYIIGGIVIVVLAAVVVYFSMNQTVMQFESVCEKNHKKYTKLCLNIGKRAHSIKSVINLNDKDFGPILGVAWRKKGSIISSRGRERRYSERNAYYYIIGSDNSSYQYLRLVDQTDPR